MFFKKDKIKEIAKYLLDIANKIENYRKDVLTKEQSNVLKKAREQISHALTLTGKEACENFDAVDQLLKSIGGAIYPMPGLVENAEVFLFAAILALAVRTFFFQPFQIPTNSMWPTYAGMTFELVEGRKNVFEKFKRWTLWGASNFNAQANETGTLRIPLMMHKNSKGKILYGIYYKIVKTRKYLGLLPNKEREYTFVVGSGHITLRVPLEFCFDEMALAALFPEKKSWNEVLDRQPPSCFQYIAINRDEHKEKIEYFDTGIQKSPGEDIFNFDILSGDMLFVDKISYHFSQPKIGDSFVFRTRSIESLDHDDKYFIKRLVGLSKDTLEIEGTTLYRNGNPIEGAEAFELNRYQTGKYPGYANDGLLKKGFKAYIPENCYFAMGDNSPNSYDSRGWGFVPNREVIGKAVFILYPFTHRWGRAK